MIARTALWLALTSTTAAPGEAPAWVGVWRQVQDPGVLLHLEPTRATHRAEGELSFFRVRESGDAGLVLEASARLTHLSLGLTDDGRLELELVSSEAGNSSARPGGGWNGTYEPLEALPDELRLPTVPLGEALPVDEDVRVELVAELIERRNEDQRVRSSPPPWTPEQMREAQEVDADNVEFLKGILEEFGWIDAERFGRDANQGAFLIVQHSMDLALMHTTLPFIEEEARAGRSDAQYYALLFDRYRLYVGHPQRFGTQLFTTTKGELVLMPMEEPERVEERRAELGIFPLSEYLEMFAEDGGGGIRTLDEALAD